MTGARATCAVTGRELNRIKALFQAVIERAPGGARLSRTPAATTSRCAGRSLVAAHGEAGDLPPRPRRRRSSPGPPAARAYHLQSLPAPAA
jgi:hypothetical protein